MSCVETGGEREGGASEGEGVLVRMVMLGRVVVLVRVKES